MKKQIKKVIGFTAALALAFTFHSCDDLDKFELPEAGSIADATPPEADFSFSQGAGPDEEWKDYTFANLSTSATTYSWDFGDGNTSTEVDGANTYAGEGTFTVTLTASDALGVTSTFSQTFDVVEPEAPAVPDPVLVNADFDKLAKLGSSNLCSCSGWDNDDIGEIRILAGSGYTSGYTPTYYATAPEFPNSGYGYTTVAQVETAANNLLVETITNPDDDDYFTKTYTFNAGANDSVALFIRGLGGDSSAGSYGYTSGDEEIRADSVTITAVN